ncbi:MAG: c-type cytochrome [Deltaproteobacteria bacterium]|nr:c-type cytochrome [Deltaproteobacteria bacterium]
MRKVLLLVVVLAAACGKKAETTGDPGSAAEPAAPSTPGPHGAAAVRAANDMFKTVCAACHGENGKGDGPASSTLNPKPRNYTDKAWQASVTDEQITQTILMGGAAVGKSPAMPAQPQLKEQPDVVKNMVMIIREFGK